MFVKVVTTTLVLIGLAMLAFDIHTGFVSAMSRNNVASDSLNVTVPVYSNDCTITS